MGGGRGKVAKLCQLISTLRLQKHLVGFALKCNIWEFIMPTKFWMCDFISSKLASSNNKHAVCFSFEFSAGLSLIFLINSLHLSCTGMWFWHNAWSGFIGGNGQGVRRRSNGRRCWGRCTGECSTFPVIETSHERLSPPLRPLQCIAVQFSMWRLISVSEWRHEILRIAKHFCSHKGKHFLSYPQHMPSCCSWRSFDPHKQMFGEDGGCFRCREVGKIHFMNGYQP